MKSPIKKITIAGVGMIGGSIALGLKRILSSLVTIYGFNSTSASTRKALQMGIIDKGLDSLTDIPADTDIFILSTPIEITKLLIPKLAKLHLPKTLFIDVGSIKTAISAIVKAHTNPIFSYISTHPMAGGQQKGMEFADPFLFRNKPWIVCMIDPVAKDKTLILDELISALGAHKIILESHVHDEIIVWSSHIPLMIASILVQSAFTGNQKSVIEKTASTGFRDTTRLASHDATFKTEIALNNSENILEGLHLLKKEIDVFSAMVQGKKARQLKQYFTDAKKKRDNWLSKQFA